MVEWPPVGGEVTMLKRVRLPLLAAAFLGIAASTAFGAGCGEGGESCADGDGALCAEVGRELATDGGDESAGADRRTGEGGVQREPDPGDRPDAESGSGETVQPDSAVAEGGTGDRGTADSGPPGDPGQPGEPSPDRSPAAGPCRSGKPRCAAGYACRDDVSPPACRLVCDPWTRGACPPGNLCLVLSSGEGVCVQGSEVDEGDTCDPSRICGLGLLCVLSGSGGSTGTCHRRCTVARPGCKAEELCYLVHSRNGACIKGKAGTGAVGSPCKTAYDCAPLLICFQPTGQTPRCAELCDPSRKCPQGFACRPLKGAPVDFGACVK